MGCGEHSNARQAALDFKCNGDPLPADFTHVGCCVTPGIHPAPAALVTTLALMCACEPQPSVGDLALAPDESYDVVKTEIADGLVYWKMYSEVDKQRLHVVVADLSQPDLKLDAETSNDSLFGFERTSEIFRRLRTGGEKPLVAINADFWHRDGAPVGMFVDDGQIWRGPWYGTGDESGVTRSIFAFNTDSEVALGLPQYDLSLTLPDQSVIEIADVNLSESDNRSMVFTDRYPAGVPVSAGWEYLSFLSAAGTWIPNEPLRLTYSGSIEQSRKVARGEVVVALPDSTAEVIEREPSGDFLLLAQLNNLQTPVDGVLGALPRLIVTSGDSVVVDPVRFASEEGVRANFVTDFHPRTAIGYDEDLNWLYLVAVDGRSESAAGIDLVKLAHLFREWGCELALNFDGGGSTTMVVDGAVVNSPSDRGGERPVSNSLLLRER